MADRHIETIICPECLHVQEAEVLHTIPFDTYIHACTQCHYLIMESDWQEVEEQDG